MHQHFRTFCVCAPGTSIFLFAVCKTGITYNRGVRLHYLQQSSQAKLVLQAQGFTYNRGVPFAAAAPFQHCATGILFLEAGGIAYYLGIHPQQESLNIRSGSSTG